MNHYTRENKENILTLKGSYFNNLADALALEIDKKFRKQTFDGIVCLLTYMLWRSQTSNHQPFKMSYSTVCSAIGATRSSVAKYLDAIKELGVFSVVEPILKFKKEPKNKRAKDEATNKYMLDMFVLHTLMFTDCQTEFYAYTGSRLISTPKNIDIKGGK